MRKQSFLTNSLLSRFFYRFVGIDLRLEMNKCTYFLIRCCLASTKQQDWARMTGDPHPRWKFMILGNAVNSLAQKSMDGLISRYHACRHLNIPPTSQLLVPMQNDILAHDPTSQQITHPVLLDKTRRKDLWGFTFYDSTQYETVHLSNDSVKTNILVRVIFSYSENAMKHDYIEE